MNPRGTVRLSPRSRLPLAAGLVVLLTALVYARVGSFAFVELDDPYYVYQNEDLARLRGAAAVRCAFTSTLGGNYQPLVWLSFFADRDLWHLRPGPMHVENAALHAMSGVLVLLLLTDATGAFGRDVQITPNLLGGTVALFGLDYSLYRLFAVLAAVLIGGSCAALLEGTRLGLKARAVIMNEALARALGIDTARVRLATFAIGAGLSALAGVLLTPLTSVDPNMGVAWLIGAFMLVMVAGGSFAALAVACLVFGAVQVLVSTFVSPILGSISVAVLAAVVLRFSPRGFARA